MSLLFPHLLGENLWEKSVKVPLLLENVLENLFISDAEDAVEERIT